MRLTPLTALLLVACSTSTPTTSPGGSTSTSVGTSAEALRKQRQLDADDVERCRDLVELCSNVEGSDADGAGDAGSSRGCGRLIGLCDQLEEQLAADRAELEQCLEEAAACEAAATDPAECDEERAACEPTDRDFRDRRGQTLECSDRAKQCFGRERGRGGDDADAGANACVAGDDDFIGCCEGKHGRGRDRGDAGVGGGDRGPGFGFRPGDAPGAGNGPFGRGDEDRGDDGDRDGDKDDDGADAGRPRRRF